MFFCLNWCMLLNFIFFNVHSSYINYFLATCCFSFILWLCCSRERSHIRIWMERVKLFYCNHISGFFSSLFSFSWSYMSTRLMCSKLFVFSGQKYYYNRKTNVSQWEHPGVKHSVPQHHRMVSTDAMDGNLGDRPSMFPKCMGCGGWGLGLVQSWGYCNHCTRFVYSFPIY